MHGFSPNNRPSSDELGTNITYLHAVLDFFYGIFRAFTMKDIIKNHGNLFTYSSQQLGNSRLEITISFWNIFLYKATFFSNTNMY